MFEHTADHAIERCYRSWWRRPERTACEYRIETVLCCWLRRSEVSLERSRSPAPGRGNPRREEPAPGRANPLFVPLPRHNLADLRVYGHEAAPGMGQDNEDVRAIQAAIAGLKDRRRANKQRITRDLYDARQLDRPKGGDAFQARLRSYADDLHRTNVTHAQVQGELRARGLAFTPDPATHQTHIQREGQTIYTLHGGRSAWGSGRPAPLRVYESISPRRGHRRKNSTSPTTTAYRHGVPPIRLSQLANWPTSMVRQAGFKAGIRPTMPVVCSEPSETEQALLGDGDARLSSIPR